MENDLEQLLTHEVAYFRMVADVEKRDCAWFLHGPELPEYQDGNHALRLRDDGRGPDHVAQSVILYYRERDLIVVADIDAVAEEQGIGMALRRRGITPVLSNRRRMRYLPTIPPLVPDTGVEVRKVPNETGKGEARDWIETVMSNEDTADYAMLWRNITEREARYDKCTLYLGYQKGEPAGACDLFLDNGMGRIESVVTRPEFRRQGVASSVVARAVEDALRAGCQTIYLFTETGGTGEKLYTRLGFTSWGINVLRRHLG